MNNVTQITERLTLLAQAKNLNIAIAEACKAKGLTPDQMRARLENIELLAREAHDCIVDAEFEQQGKPKKGGF